MGDSINVDWGLAQDQARTTGDMPAYAEQNALAGYQLGQQAATRTALNGMDVDSPESVAKATSGLVRAGNVEAAKGISDLGYKRDLWNKFMGGDTPADALMARTSQGATQSSFAPQPNALAGTEPQPPPNLEPTPQAAPTPGDFKFDPQHAYDTMNSAAHAMHELMQLPDEERYAAATDTGPESIRASFAKRGIPPEAIDAALDDLSPSGLAEKRDHYAQVAGALAKQTGAKAQGVQNPNPVTTGPNGEQEVNVVANGLGGGGGGNGGPPSGANPALSEGGGTFPPAAPPLSIPLHSSTLAWARNHPDWSKALLDDPRMLQQIAAMRSFGLDLSPLVTTAEDIENPRIGQAATIEAQPAILRQRNEATVGETNVGPRTVQAPVQDILDSTKGRLTGSTAPPAYGQPGVGMTPAEHAASAAYGQGLGSAPFDLVTVPMGPDYRPTTMGKSVLLANQGKPGVAQGPGVRENADIQGDVANANAFRASLPDQRQQLQQAENRGQQIAALAGVVGTGKYGPAVQELSRTFPLGAKTQAYASNAGLLVQDLGQSLVGSMGGKPDAGAVTSAVGHLHDQGDQLKLYGASMAAGARYKQAQNDFMETEMNRNGGSFAKAQAAWDAGPGQRSFLSDPAFQNLQVKNSQGRTVRAVEIQSNPKLPHYGYGVFMPHSPEAYTFKAF